MDKSKPIDNFWNAESNEAEIERLQKEWIENGSYDSFKHSKNLLNLKNFPRPKNWFDSKRIHTSSIVRKWEPTGFLKGYTHEEKQILAELCEEAAKYVITLPTEDMWVSTMMVPIVKNIFDILVTEGLPTSVKFELILSKIVALKRPARDMYEAIYGDVAEIDESFYSFVSIQIVKSIFYEDAVIPKLTTLPIQ